MEYNKKQFQKASDKKVLHKIKKHWVVLSTALLMAVAGGATMVGGTASANAASTGNANSNDRTNQTNTLKERINASLTQDHQQNYQQNIPTQRAKVLNSSEIDNQASALHNRILANAASNSVGRTNNSQVPSAVNTPSAKSNVQMSGINARQLGTINSAQNGAFASQSVAKQLNVSQRRGESNPNQEIFSDIPVTIKYVNSDGKVQQYIPPFNSDHPDQNQTAQPNIQTAYVSVKGNAGQNGVALSPSQNANGAQVYNNLYSDVRGLYSDGAKSAYNFVPYDQPGDFSVNLTGTGIGYQFNKPSHLTSDAASDSTNVPANANWDSTNNRPMFVLKANDAQPINVNYINESGLSIKEPDTNYQISGHGRFGDTLDVRDTSRGGVKMPGNNGKSDFSNGSDYKLASDSTLRDYTFGANPQNVTVPLEGKKFGSNENVSGPNGSVNKLVTYDPNRANDTSADADKSGNSKLNYLTVNIYKRSNHRDPRTHQRMYIVSDEAGDGRTKDSDTRAPIAKFHKYIGGQIGNTTTVDPHDKWITNQLSGYQVDPQYNHAARIYFKGDGHGHGVMGTLSGSTFTPLNHQSIDFTYDAGPRVGHAKNITVQFQNQYRSILGSKTFHGSDGTNGSNGNYGDTINVTTDNGQNSGNSIVPAGYSLDSDQPTHYTYDSDSQNIIMLVHGNQETTNSGREHNQHPLNITLEKDYYSDGGTYQAKSDASVHPTITGNVGDIDVHAVQIDPSSFLSDIKVNGHIVQPASHKYYGINFNGNGTVSSTDPSVGGVGNLTIKYNVYPNPVKRSKIRIHYVSVNPDGTDNLNGTDIPNTEVSDFNQTGASFGVNKGGRNYAGDSYYRENVPRGYQFYKVLKVNNQNVSQKNSDKGITNFSNSDQDETIEVIPVSQGMTIHYVDQMGNHIYSDQEPGEVKSNQARMPYKNGQGTGFVNEKDQIGNSDRHTSRYGDMIYAYKLKNGTTDYQPADNNQVTAPNGHVINNYHVVNETSGYRFQKDPKDYYVMIAGNTVHNPNSRYNNDTAMIYVHEENPAGRITKTYQVPDHIDGDMDDNYVVDADSYTPNGYKVDTRYPQHAEGQITKNGLTKRRIDFYYTYNNDQNYQDLKNIDVTFMDDNQEVGFNQIVPQNGDYEGENVDVTTRGTDGYHLPAGYQLDANQNTSTTFSKDRYNQLILQVYKPAEQAEGTFSVIQNLYHLDKSGNKQFDRTIVKNVPEAGKSGSQFKVLANDYQVDGYKEVTQAHPVNGLNNDSDVIGHFNASGIDPVTAEFNYVATNSSNDNGGGPSGHKPVHPSDVDPNGPVGPVTPSEAEPIYVQYYQGEGTDNKIGSDTRVDGYMGQKYSDITKQVHVPSGKYLIEGQRLNYTIGDQEQQVDLHVDTVNAQAKNFPLTLKIEDPNGNVINAKTKTQNIMVNGNSTDTLIPSDYYPNQDATDYHLDTSNHRDQIITVNNNNGTLTPTSGTFYYVANTSKHNPSKPVGPNNPSDKNIKPITVSYINKSDGRNVETKVLSDGFMGQTINVTDPTYAPVPSDFQLDPDNQNVSYTFGTQPQNVVLTVDGKPTNPSNDSGKDALTVNYTLIHSDGSVTNGSGSDNLSGQYGSNVMVDPNSLIGNGNVIPSGYSVLSSTQDPSDIPQSIHFNSDGTITPNQVHFTYERSLNPDVHPNAAGVLELNYIDQDHKQVGSYLISGHNGQKISDVTTGADGGHIPPAHYSVVPGQNVKFQFDTHDHVMNINVIGDRDNDNAKNQLKAHIVKVNRDGSESSDVQTVTLKDKSGVYDPNGSDAHIGSDVAVYPTDFTPNGYQISPADTTAQVQVNSDDTLSPNEVSFVYDQNVDSDAGNIILNYYNQDGHQVGQKDYTLSGKDNDGKTVDVTDGDSATNDGITGEAVPTGYHIVPGQQTRYTFGANPQKVNLQVQGDSVPSDSAKNLLTVNLREHNGNQTHIITRHVYVHEDVGSDQTYSPEQYVPRGYHVDSADNNHVVTMQPDHSITISNNDGNNNKITWDYDVNNAKSKPLILKYWNQAGHQVGTTDEIPGYIGQKITDITQSDQGGEAVPNGYTLNPNQPTSYVLSSDVQTVNLQVTGEQEYTPVRINEVKTDSDGQQHFISDVYYSIPQAEDRVGNVIKITPSDTQLQPAGYDVDARDKDAEVTIGPNNSLGYSTTPINMHDGSIVYYYNEHVVQGGPIAVSYINQDGQMVGKTKYLHGHVGDTINAITDPNQGDPIPTGYDLDRGDSSSNYNKTFTKTPQNVIISVQGKHYSDAFTVYVKKQDQNGNPVGDIRAVEVHQTDLPQYVGDTTRITPYLNGLTPAGYHADPSDASIPVSMNTAGQLSPVNNIEYDYTQDYQPENIGTINVHYVTSAGYSQNSADSLDVVSDHGVTGDKFNLVPYRYDIPDKISSDYAPTGKVYLGGSDDTPSTDITSQVNSNPQYLSFANGARDVYIQVTPVGDTDNDPTGDNGADSGTD